MFSVSKAEHASSTGPIVMEEGGQQLMEFQSTKLMG